MHWWAIILSGAWLNVCGIWIGLLIAQLRLPRQGVFLQPVGASEPTVSTGTPRPSLCVVIPARNESEHLRDCIQSILDQDYPALSVMIVDDRSTDDTPEIAERLAAADPRIQVRKLTDLPAGWMGKSHALWEGTRGLDSDWFLFVDADCRLHRSAVNTAILKAQRRGVDLLTLWPRHAGGSFWEHMLIPLCGGIIALWFGSPEIQGGGRRTAFANGQFLLIRREAYERIDGHRSVRNALIEDVPLAEKAREAGLRLHVASGREIAAVRMYSDFQGIMNGWARIYVGALRSGVKIALSILWLLAGSLLPYVAAIALAWTAWRGTPAEGRTCLALAGICGLHLLLIGVVSYRFWGWGRCPRRYLLLYPLSVVVVTAILARSWWWLVVRRQVPWRSTVYTIGRRALITGRTA